MIDARRLSEIVEDCLYTDEEIRRRDKEEIVKEAIIVEGIVNNFGFNPAKIEKYKGEIYKMLLELPKQFMKSGGGGWSFLNMCIDKEGNQWTGLHANQEMLACLGIAIGKASWIMKEMAHIMPGGMLYFVVDDTDDNMGPEKN